jgi:hypothetical protein
MPEGAGRRPGPWPAVVFVAATALSLFLLVAFSRGPAGRGDRVLSVLDPFIGWLRSGGLFLLQVIWKNRAGIGWAVTAGAVLLAVGGFVRSRTRALPLFLLASGVTCATWGQLQLVAGRIGAGWILYGAGVLSMIALGVFFPLEKLSGTPRLSGPGDWSSGGGEPAWPGWKECGLLFGLVLVALATRGWALNQLPNFFDDEMISTTTASATAYGLREYVKTEFLGTSNGFFQLPVNFLLFKWLGFSLWTVRVPSLLFGIAAIPLFYFLARRLFGTASALVTTTLFVAAPEQLFWSRSESSVFSLVAICGLVTAHIGVSMVKRLSPGGILAAALWTPVCRFFYTACYVLVAYPFLLLSHSVLFVRGALRLALRAAPLLLAGVFLWIGSVSLVLFLVSGSWEFINPATVRGSVAWKYGTDPGAGPLDVIRIQTVRIARNLRSVAEGLTTHDADHPPYSSPYYQRFFLSEAHNTTINMGMAVLAALGLGYLVGQLHDRRSALLLFWLALGLLPGCMSDEPDARRISLIFPVLSMAGGLALTVWLRVARQGLGRVAGAGAALAGGLAAAGVFGTSLASHLLLPVGPVAGDEQIRFARPLFDDCDLVVHNLFYRFGKMIAFGNLERILQPGGVGFQYAENKDWPAQALGPACDFRNEVYAITLPPGQIEMRRKTFRPRRVGYLLRRGPASQSQIDLLRGLFPSVPVREQAFVKTSQPLFAMEVPWSEIERLAAPALTAANLPLKGGLLLQEDGWYRFRLEPPCPQASLRVGEPPLPGDRERPLLAGVQPFEIRAKGARSCSARMSLLVEPHGGAAFPAPLLVSAQAAAVPEVRARSVVTFPGFGTPRKLASLDGRALDFGADAEGRLYVLAFRSEHWELHILSPDGRQEALARPDLPGEPVGSLAVARDGGCAVRVQDDVELYDVHARLVSKWKLPPGGQPMGLSFLPDGRLIFCMKWRRVLDVFSRDGRHEDSLKRFGGEPGHFTDPIGVAVSPDGSLAVTEEEGAVLLFANPGPGLHPVFLRSFFVDWKSVPDLVDLKGIAFDGPDRLLVPHEPKNAPFLYSLRGERMLARDPERDLSAGGLKGAFRFAATPRSLLVVGRFEPISIWRIDR